MLKLQNLEKTVGNFKLSNISLTASAGETLVLLGPCGSGKTVLLECISGLIKHDSGSITMNEQEIGNLSPEKRRIGFVYQNYSLFPHLSVMENITYGIRYFHNHTTHENRLGKNKIRSSKDDIREILNMLELDDLSSRTTPATLSGGEQQKVALARALAIKPRLLLLDEPLSSLDFNTSESVGNILRNIPSKLGIPIVCVTHSHEEAAILGNSVCLLMNGRIEQQGSRKEVFSKPASLKAATFLGAKNLIPCNGEPGEFRAGPFVLMNSGTTPENLPDHNSSGYLAVRPESISIISSHSSEKHDPKIEKMNFPCWQGKLSVISIEDRCRFLRVMLKSENLLIEADLAGDARLTCPLPGTVVTARFPRNCAHFIPDQAGE
ncbi:MAG: ABC transporter ATP-binding protein [Candidatus Wallbacteria bacterium HGW-Wallbacteria-1]|jgi:ABC-type sugar transport system ATPase subunit|uniref:ABC transporter ATP-binding protein n=1 Tax=Candidatus Wallbacteria bacterium HGW-Wallbacteria-1 TaxID=2013854 RepID=A0A2N1PQZ8_9BACT|nr:MAG: ABC transporter ATP-binding protein [Candidatus Wallbacteria bacterium HGW-Wallbacteria-1]